MIDVLFVVLPDSLILDWAGPAEALRIANQVLVKQGMKQRFRLHFVGPKVEPRTSVGVSVTGIEPLPKVLPESCWVVLLGMPGEHIDVSSAATRAAIEWLQKLQFAENQMLVTICAGALLAAHAGLLRGCRVTTHHHHLQELQDVAAGCDVVSNRVFVMDGKVASSAGVTTGIDLTLHLISQECSSAVAAHVAQAMVVALRRGPQDPELSPFLAHRNHMHPGLHRVQDAVAADPQSDWTVRQMADVACTSARHLTRLFDAHASIAPLEYLRRLRLSVAQAALASGQNVTQAAEMAGFSSDTQLRRAWRRFNLPGTPSTVTPVQCP